ncbi:IS3 family transposase [Nocardia sp. CA-084685]|uniref:IS3 family transposase n=1 Tax=Nocardia sp. CA-084685 TaxID=3239970 RepID=UPI003D9962CC
MASEGLPVQAACRLLDVSESGFYAWRSRPPSNRDLRHAWLTDQIRAVHTASRGVYGAMRVHAELTLGLGLTVGHGQIEMLMARAGLKGLPGNRRPRPRHETPDRGRSGFACLHPIGAKSVVGHRH